jgi:hypothetical protein
MQSIKIVKTMFKMKIRTVWETKKKLLIKGLSKRFTTSWNKKVRMSISLRKI